MQIGCCTALPCTADSADTCCVFPQSLFDRVSVCRAAGFLCFTTLLQCTNCSLTGSFACQGWLGQQHTYRHTRLAARQLFALLQWTDPVTAPVPGISFPSIEPADTHAQLQLIMVQTCRLYKARTSRWYVDRQRFPADLAVYVYRRSLVAKRATLQNFGTGGGSSSQSAYRINRLPSAGIDTSECAGSGSLFRKRWRWQARRQARPHTRRTLFCQLSQEPANHLCIRDLPDPSEYTQAGH